MALPDLIEISPVSGAVGADISVPGSKSITNRALILAALAEGQTVLKGALWSEDTQVMVDCLRKLGMALEVLPEPGEACNRTLRINGCGGRVSPGGAEASPLELFVGNAGTAARFLAAFVCLGSGFYRLHGVPRMHQRPQADLFRSLRQLGYRIQAAEDRLPATIQGGGPRPGSCTVSIEESSQFASALLLCGAKGGWQVQVQGENAEESPYVQLTDSMVAAFPCSAGTFQVEPDASSASYIWAADHLLRGAPDPWDSPAIAQGHCNPQPPVTLQGGRPANLQVDSRFYSYVSAPWELGLREQLPAGSATAPTRQISRATDLGDSIMTAIVLAPFWTKPTRFTDLGRLRLQECERVAALKTELARCGARVLEEGDSLTVSPSPLRGAQVQTYDDHRMAMCFAVLGLKVPEMRIENPRCVRKTFPNFFQKLAGPPPAGLGAKILDAKTRRELAFQELFAD